MLCGARSFVNVPRMKYYLAGGAVRSILLGLRPRDHDFAFDGTPDAFIAANPSARKLGDSPAYQYQGHEFSPLHGSVQEDLQHRDFTVNSFLLEENGVLHMHPDTLGDLRAGRLHPASPDSFRRDPLRVFRAARFCAVYPEFSPSGTCLELMEQEARGKTFTAIAAERVGQECLKAFSGPRPGNFFRVLSRAKALNYWFAELEGAADIPAGPPQFHRADVLDHIAATVDSAAGQARDLAASRKFNIKQTEKLAQVTAWMALCHDLGKVLTPPELLPHHYEHEIRGIKAAEDLTMRLKLPSRLKLAGRLAAQLHMKAGIYGKLRPSTRVDLLMQAHTSHLFIPFFLLAQADSGLDHLLELAENELQVILKVKLPPELENQGVKSGQRLRELRSNKLARHSGRQKN